MQFKLILTALAALVPLVASTSISSSKDCKSGEFWWSDKNCCLTKGGPSTLPTPPKDITCPPTSYYWGEKQGCCVPRNQPPSNPTPPQCPKNWTWYPSLYRCQPSPTPPSPPSTNPSNYPGNGNGNGGHQYRKRSLKSRATLCPSGLDACPIFSSLAGEYECLDTSSELESCGGCTSLGQGQDCTKITGARVVGCDRGSCIVHSCAKGFQFGADGKTCVPL